MDDLIKKHNILCDKHRPNSGDSWVCGTCLMCGIQELSYALSRISYICDIPNDMQVSSYDLSCDPEQVIKQVEKSIASHRQASIAR